MLNHVEGETSGSPLVLHHCVSERWQNALPLIPEIFKYLHVYAPGLRGHRLSDRVVRLYRLTMRTVIVDGEYV